MSTNESEAIILLGHGSRVKNAGKHMEEVAASLKKNHGFPVVEICYLSRLGPHFPEVFDAVVKKGAREIVVIPYFLHGGMHILLDIPEMMQQEAVRHPDVRVILGRNLGFDELLVDLVNKRISESAEMNDVKDLELPQRNHYPVPKGQCEFVPMKPEEAEAYRRRRGGDGHHHHH